ncbi:MAG: cytochrome c3 family protein [Candidatus Sumerlaeia bacterium]|nr:cytochrome c3 family protein [Candidatus Sumerlaeia bacterium]
MLQYWRVFVLVIALMAVGFYQLYGVFSNAGYAPAQPIPFSHVLHSGVMNMECLYCHGSAEKGAHAGIPSMDVCMGCHSIVRTDSPDIQRLTEYYNNGEAVPWVRIHALPDHSYFSHQWHVAAGIACQTCHGPVQEMATVRQWSKLEMGECMACHRQDTYVANIDRVPSFNERPVTDEEIAEVTSGAYEISDVDADFASLSQHINGNGRQYSEAEAQVIVRRLEEYRSDIYLHGRHVQLRGKNASIECSICHY